MMNKTLKKILTCLLVCFTLACAAGFIITSSPEKVYAFTGLTDITEEDLYNQTNTFNISPSCFEDNGNFKTVEDTNRKTNTIQYRLLYDMSNKNDNEVMDTAQITVLTPGLGSYASVWSNVCPEGDENEFFAYDSQSIIAKIKNEIGEANIYWVKCSSDFRFNLYDITDETEEGKKYTKDKKIENITDISKHIIIVFEVDDATESHDNVYYQLNYALSKIMYDVKILNGGKLPKLNLIGHSRGGITNLQFTLDHPDLVESLVSIGAPYFASTTARIYGKISSKDTDGLDDILNSELYYGYNKRWNNNYDNLYKDVNVYAYGSYHTLMSISEAMFYDMSGKISDLGATGIAALFSAINVAKIATGFHHFGEQLVLKLIAECLDTLYPDSAVVDAAEILFKELDFDIYPAFVSWFNDILVPLDSQLGEDGGNTEDGTGTYRGFRRIVRPFIGGDADYTKVAQKEPPVGHNLEPRDAVIINNIICNLDFGVNTNSGYLISEKDDGTVRVEGYKGTYSSDNLVIPSSINGKTVTEIAPFAFLGLDKSNIKTITLGDSIEKIGMYAFSDFTEAENISIGTDSHLKEIREGAFNNCSKITVMKFPATLENIIPTALMNCNSLTAVTVPGNNAKYSSIDGVLYTKNKEILKLYPAGRQSESYTVDNSCIAIGDYAFINNADIASLNLNNVNSIDFYGIFNCEKLADVVASKLDYVEQGAFYKTLWLDNNSAEFVILGNVLIRYQGNATDLKISNVTSIAPAAFIANDTITSISLGGDLVNIGRYAFYSCEKLEKVYIENLDSLIYIGTDSFGKNAENREIYVPFTLKEEYSANELWNRYNTKTYETNINYSLNGGLFADNESYPQTIEYGNIWNIPDPVRTAYSFDGWYIVDQNGNVSDEKITNGQIWKNYDENVTLLAKWSPIQYTIILVADGGTVSETNLHYTIENSVSLPSPEYDGYTFNGWYADSNLTEDSYVGNSLQKGTYGDKIFYAKRTANSYTVSLNLKDSEKDPGKVNQTTVKVTFNNSYILPVAERNGYIFDGWEDANGELYTTEEGVSFKPWDVAEDTELFARWTVKKYYIKVDANGTIFWIGAGGFSDTWVSIEYGTKFKNITELEEAFNPKKISYKEGHKFSYFTLEDGTKFTSWTEIPDLGADGTIVCINAQFVKEVNFSILFNGEAVSGGINPVTANYGEPISLMTASAKEGYTFKHWIVSENGNSDVVTKKFIPGSIFNYTTMPDLSPDIERDGENIYLDAVYEANTYIIHLSSQYSSLPYSTIKVLFNSKVELPVTSSYGRIFEGWYTEQVGGIQIATDEGIMLNDWSYTCDMTLYARWSLITYTIKYEDGYTLTPYPDKFTHSNPTSFTVDDLPLKLLPAVRSGYRFLGWHEDSYCNNTVTYIYKNMNQTVYAKWVKVYTLNFDTQGGTLCDSIEGAEGETIILPESTRSGYYGTWVYWGYLTNDSTKSNFGYSYTITKTVSALQVAWKEKTLEECLVNNVYEIWTFNQLNSIRNNAVKLNNTNYIDGSYKLMDDIKVTGSWTPIPYIFKGTFDGNNKTIKNFKININGTGSETVYVGMFRTISGIVKNLTFDSANIKVTAKSHVYVGTISGDLKSGGKIENCSVKYLYVRGDHYSISVSASNSNTIVVGGLTGYIQGGSILKSNFAGVIYTSSNGSCEAGGLVGRNTSGKINRCYTTGSLNINSTGSKSDFDVGGLVGRNVYNASTGSNPEIMNSYSTAEVFIDCTGKNSYVYAGGLVGVLRDSKLKYCYATGKVTGKNKYGRAIAGGLAADIEDCISEGYVTNVFSTGDVYARGNYSGAETSSSFFGHFCGAEKNNRFLKIYYNKDAKFKDGKTGKEVTWNSSWYNGKTVDELKTRSFQINELGLDISIWNIKDGLYPTLK